MTALAGSWSCLQYLGHRRCSWDGISTAIHKDPGDKDFQARDTAQRDSKVLVPSDGQTEQQNQQLPLWLLPVAALAAGICSSGYATWTCLCMENHWRIILTGNHGLSHLCRHPGLC